MHLSAGPDDTPLTRGVAAMANRICSIDGCEKKHYGNGWCAAHNALNRRNGKPEKVKVRGICSRTDCEAERYGHGLCVKHWRETRVRDLCSIEACDGLVEARGWCSKHYNRWKRHGDPLREKERARCDAQGCDVEVKALGYCIKHYTRLRTHGDANFEWVYVPPAKRACDVTWCERKAKVGPAFTRSEVMDRDGWVCQLCEGPIDRRLRYPHPLSKSLDHIIPISRGGKHALENCQASHLTCNLSKRAQVISLTTP